MPGGLKLDMSDLDDLLQTHAPHLLHPPNQPFSAVPSGSFQPTAPELGTGIAPPTMSHIGTPASIAKPTHSEDMQARTSQLRAGGPDSNFYRDQIAEAEDKKQNPRGSPDNHPGFFGKVAHGLARAGNIAGDILAPGTTALIPGTDLNNQAKEHHAENELGQAETRETAKQRANTEQESVEQQPDIARIKGEAANEVAGTKGDVTRDVAAGKTASAENIAGQKSETSIKLKDMDDETKSQIEAGRERNRDVIAATHNQLQRELQGARLDAAAKTAAGKAEGPTMQDRNTQHMAQTVQAQVPTLNAEIDHLADSIGPLKGRWNQLYVNKGGGDFPEFAGLDTDLDLFASALVKTHFGARGGQQYREELRKQFSQAQSPEDLKQRIQHADSWIKGYANIGNPQNQQGGGSSPERPAGVPADAAWDAATRHWVKH